MSANIDFVLLAWALWALASLALVAMLAVPAFRPMAGAFARLQASEAAIVAAVTTPFLLVAWLGTWPGSWLGAWPLALALAALAARIGWERGDIEAARAGPPAPVAAAIPTATWRWLGAGTVLAMGVIGWWLPACMPVALVAALVLAALIARLARATISRIAISRIIRGIAHMAVFPGLPLALLAHFAPSPAFHPLLLLAFIFVEVFDSLALFGGRLYGARPAFPALSPRKTVEGLATGALGLALVAACVNRWVTGWPPAAMAGFVAVIVASAMCGDLLASAPKRRAGRKDYPAVIAVQGGALDIADAWLVAAPAACFALPLLMRL